eukprot:5884463-Prymnesium_polylepis.1
MPATMHSTPYPMMKLRVASGRHSRCCRHHVCTRSDVFLPSRVICKVVMLTIRRSAAEPCVYSLTKPN